MNREKAYRLDKAGDFYVDIDEKSGMYGVFGTESGFCYGLYSDTGSAVKLAKKLKTGEQ